MERRLQDGGGVTWCFSLLTCLLFGTLFIDMCCWTGSVLIWGLSVYLSFTLKFVVKWMMAHQGMNVMALY